ncbi:DUF5685 family protein [Streptomyces yaizuensis]|uniref:DUF5685 family protein n=2 Tax=Streptomyces yaizuensis TaxID=2989713 RepID=A0ABQ5P0M3_9ACTN|nr:DUF5685 family protein [Streptomyces sp. YSPA8]
MAHLCGLCLALRADHGQFARVATNYDGLIISVLTEAQSVREPGHRRTAGPCPLRAMRTAPVARGEGARLAAAVSLVLASAKVRDHVTDRDGLLARRPVAAAARRVADRWARAGARTGASVGFDSAVLLDAVGRQSSIETLAGPGTPLLTVTEPTETATAAAFAHTAHLAGRPQNAAPLAEAGRLFGRLAHLLDAVEDQTADAAAGAWNPLTATGTSREEARRLADDAVHGIRLALRDADFTDDALVHALLAHEPAVSVRRAFNDTGCTHTAAATGAAPGTREPGSAKPGTPVPPPPEPRGFLPGCAAFTWVFCSGQMCCCHEYESPWSRKRREGCCYRCDCPASTCDCGGGNSGHGGGGSGGGKDGCCGDCGCNCDCGCS